MFILWTEKRKPFLSHTQFYHLLSLLWNEKTKRDLVCRGMRISKEGTDYQLSWEIEKRISFDLHSEREDIFQRDDVTEFVMSIETFIVAQFYSDRDVSDHDIYDSLAKVYAYQRGMLKELRAPNRCKELVFRTYDSVNKRVSEILTT